MGIDKLMEQLNKFKILHDEIKYQRDVYQKFSNNQFIFWYSFEDEYSQYISEQENINQTLTTLYDDEFNIYLDEAIKGIDNHTLIEPNKFLWEEIKKAFDTNLYDLVVRGLFPIADKMYADSSGLPPTVTSYLKPKRNTNVRKDRAKIIVDNLGASKEPKNLKYQFDLNILYYTYTNSCESFFENSDFSGEEPEKLNRHWIMHGRSSRKATRLDCIKLINLIYSLCLIHDYNQTIV